MLGCRKSVCVPVPLTRGDGGCGDAEQVRPEEMNAHRAKCRRAPHHLGRLAHIKGVADIPLRQGDVDVAEPFGQATDFGKRRLAGTGSRHRVRLVRGVDETAGKANGQER